jgi:hypothetical protein
MDENLREIGGGEGRENDLISRSGRIHAIEEGLSKEIAPLIEVQRGSIG